MENKVVSGIMLTLLLTDIVILAFNIQLAKSEPTTIIVPDDYRKIQWAIGNASAGDTIFVRAGTYYERVIVTKSVKLSGEDRNTTIIDGGVGISQWTSNVVISGFSIQNGDYGISLPMWSSNHVLSNNIITKNGYGIRGDYNCFKVTVSDNIITSNNFSGIWLNFAESTVSDNIISENGKSVYREFTSGIDIVEGGGNNMITGNTIKNNYMGIHACRYSEGDIIYHNNFLNNTHQVVILDHLNITSTWDDGYPSGGNYWSDHVTVDDYSGINQDEPGSDGIVDEPYIIDDYNRDNYPLVEPWSPKPPTPQEALEELIQTVELWNLDKGIENSLTSKLQAAYRSLDKENQKASLRQQTAFINQVKALRDKKLTTQQADQLISEAQRIKDLIKE